MSWASGHTAADGTILENQPGVTGMGCPSPLWLDPAAKPCGYLVQNGPDGHTLPILDNFLTSWWVPDVHPSLV